jgi:MOSC domain-containing protein YiiM
LRIESIQLGGPQTYPAANGKSITTSVYRRTATGPVPVFIDHLEQDQASNTKVHGGPEKAINVYPGEHYTFWQDALHGPQRENGSFGENLTTSGWLEQDACIGDIYTVGSAVVQLSQPRRPCATLAWRWGIPDFIRIVNESGRTGWYLRVLQEGSLKAGDEIILQERLNPEWSVARANWIILSPKQDVEATRALAGCPELAPAWVNMLRQFLG